MKSHDNPTVESQGRPPKPELNSQMSSRRSTPLIKNVGSEQSMSCNGRSSNSSSDNYLPKENKTESQQELEKAIRNILVNQNSELTHNTDLEFHLTTSDKVELNVRKVFHLITMNKNWTTPGGFFITTFVALNSVEFKSWLGIAPETIEAIFLIVCIISFVLMIRGWLLIQAAGKKITPEIITCLILGKITEEKLDRKKSLPHRIKDIISNLLR